MNYIAIFLSNVLNLFIDISLYIMLGLFMVGILNSFVNKHWLTNQIGGNNFSSIIKASLIGVPLPICSCGVVPTAIELEKSGGSKGAVVSFLTSTPQTGLDSIIATHGLLGWFMAFYRAIVAFISGVISGLIVNVFGQEKPKKTCGCGCGGNHHTHTHDVHTHSDSCGCGCTHSHDCSWTLGENETFVGKCKNVFLYGFGSFLDELAPKFIVGILFSALVSTILPDNFFLTYGLGSGIMSMILMVLIGIPMFICSTASIPIAVTLIAKGISPGAGFVFLFAGPVTNVATITMISKSLGKKITALYVSNAIFMALIFGYLLDLILDLNLITLSFSNLDVITHNNHSVFKIIVAILFFILLIKSMICHFKGGEKMLDPKKKDNCGCCDHEEEEVHTSENCDCKCGCHGDSK